MRHTIDLNCDLGEYSSKTEEQKEIAIIPYVSSANIACGLHAGNQLSIKKTISRAVQNNVGVGAHPSFPDRDNFGRKAMTMAEDVLRQVIRRQLEDFANCASAVGAQMTHVKAHGALYNMAAVDLSLAAVICETIYDINPHLLVFGLANSFWVRAANDAGIVLIEEAFADRRYLSGSQLVPRSNKQALISDALEAEQQVLRLVRDKVVTSIDGAEHGVEAGTICIHGDSDFALNIVSGVEKSLLVNQIDISYPTCSEVTGR